MNFQPWGEQVLKLKTMTAISLLGLWLSIGVMVGSVLAGQLYEIGDLARDPPLRLAAGGGHRGARQYRLVPAARIWPADAPGRRCV